MTLQELIIDLKAAGANDNTLHLALNCYELGQRDEREACAKVCDDLERAKWETVKHISENGGRLAFAGPMHCAKAIRARGTACK